MRGVSGEAANRPRAHAHRARGALELALLAALACAPSAPKQMPAVERWGDLQQPYGDSLEAAAMAALGPRPFEYDFQGTAPITLEDLWTLQGTAREMREREARGLVEQSIRRRQMNGVDSLPSLLEAVRIDPAYVPAYEEAAHVLLERGAVERAHALAVQGLRLDPGSARLWATLSQVYLRRGDDARARTALEQALELDATQVPHGHESLAILYLRSGDAARADSLARADASGDSECLRLYVAGLQAKLQGDLQAARDSLEAATRQEAAQAAMFVDLGNVEHEIGNLDAAERAFEHALRLEPGASGALNGLAAVQRGRGQLEAAVASFARLVARGPDDGAAQFNLAGTSLEAAQRAGKGPHADSLYTLAENAFGACIEARFRPEEAHQQRAHLRLRRGDNHGAMEDARTMLAVPKHAAAGRLLMARAALAAGDAQQTATILAPSFRSDSLSTDALFILGQAYLRLDRHADAAQVLQRAHDRQPEDWRTSMNLGVALSKSGNLEAAESVLRALAASRPRDPDVLQNLAAVLQKRGRRVEADRLARQAEELRGGALRR